MNHSLTPIENNGSQSTEDDNLSVPINQHMFASLGGPGDFFYSQPSVNGVLMGPTPMPVAPANEYNVVAPPGYNGPQYLTSAYVASDLGVPSTSPSQGYSGYASSQSMLIPQTEVPFHLSGNGLYFPQPAQQPAPSTSVSQSDVETVSNGQNADPELQHDFLQFLMANLRLLNSITYPSETAIALIQNEFARSIQNRGIDPPILDIQKIGLQFKPVVGTAATRQQGDNRIRTQTKVIECPFPFCDGHFTRAAGLRNHLSGHFSLTPKQCLRCGKCFSDASIKRHEGTCARGASSHLDI